MFNLFYCCYIFYFTCNFTFLILLLVLPLGKLLYMFRKKCKFLDQLHICRLLVICNLLGKLLHKLHKKYICLLFYMPYLSPPYISSLLSWLSCSSSFFNSASSSGDKSISSFVSISLIIFIS